MDLLVSEDESSGSESEYATKQVGSLSLRDGKRNEPDQEPESQEVHQAEYADSNGEEDDNSPAPLNEKSASDIKSEAFEHKVTTSASVILNRLPPSSSQVVKKITQESNVKITIRCQPIGSTPALSPTVFKISETQPFSTLIKFINKKLKKRLPNKEKTVYCYINNSFAPSPDEIIGNLHKHFSTNNELIISYCHVVAFG